MKTAGLIGGMSWESTVEYYKQINEGIKNALGGLHSGKILLYSFDFDEIERLQHKNQWDKLKKMLSDAGIKLKTADADFLAICTNTMHKIADDIGEITGLKVIHIADVTGENIIQRGQRTVGLLGTKFTMLEDFYKKRLETKYGIKVIIPEEKEMNRIHEIIYNELCCGIIKSQSKAEFISIINNLKTKGAEGVILGCTEIPLLIGQKDLDIRIFDSMKLHTEAIVREMLKD